MTQDEKRLKYCEKAVRFLKEKKQEPSRYALIQGDGSFIIRMKQLLSLVVLGALPVK